MANEEHVERLRRSVDEWNQWREKHPEIRPDLGYDFRTNANLSDANLYGADLSDADLRNADLRNADLRSAKLNGANLGDANLYGANLCGADLSGTDLGDTDLTNVDLRDADLYGADLSGADLHGTRLSGTRFWYTILARIDLRAVKGLTEINHQGPCRIELPTVRLPQDGSTLHFLRGVGVPEEWIVFYQSTMIHAIQYHSLFISYSSKDDTLARHLYADLQESGVSCWFAPHNLRPGTPIVRGIEEAIHLHEKLLLILSQHAVMSHWVQQEVEAALYKEATTGQEILFPIRLDNTILESETLWAQRLRQRHIADFTNWQDEVAYQEAFTTLLQHLKVKQ